MNKNFKITGEVSYCGKSNSDDARVNVLLKISDEQIEKLRGLIGDEDDYDGIPLKETDAGDIVFKMGSKFDIALYDNGTLVDEDEMTIDTIGKGSIIQCFFSLGETSFKRKKFKVAYLKSINIIDLIESTKFNPFEEDSEVETI